MYSNQNQLDLTEKTIVIVDDDIASIRYFEVLLKTTGASVITFMNGTDIIDYISKNPKSIDLIMIDYLIPFINGIDCIKQIRKLNNSVPLIMVTAYYTRESKEEAYLAGCNEYILKPVIPDKILNVLKKYLIQREFVQL